MNLRFQSLTITQQSRLAQNTEENVWWLLLSGKKPLTQLLCDFANERVYDKGTSFCYILKCYVA